VGLKYNLEHAHAPGYKLYFGAGLVYHDFRPGMSSYERESNKVTLDTAFNQETYNGLESNAFIENHLSWKNFFFANIGYRFSHYYLDKQNIFFHEPRVFLKVKPFQNIGIKASYARMNQYVHMLSYGGLGLPADLWIPSTPRICPETSDQVSLGMASDIAGQLELTLEAYYKKMYNLITLKEGVMFFSSSLSWQDKIETGGVGHSKGFEILLHKKRGNTGGWIGYTLSKTERKFDNLNMGRYYPYKYDRRHDLSFVFIQKLMSGVDFSVAWVYGTGNAITLPYEAYDGIEIKDDYHSEIQVQEVRNNFRTEPYHRLDLGINFMKEKKWGKRTWNVSVYNLYNRMNAYYYFTRTTRNGLDEQYTKLYKFVLFPIIPSVSYSFVF
jgi:hypothetical protein